jgi:ligand-binding SRPBCC domain-containing protein
MWYVTGTQPLSLPRASENGMATVVGTVTVDAPPEVVWDVVSDVERYAELSSAFTDEVRYVSDRPVGEGTVYREYGGIGPMKDESEWVITTFTPPTRQVHEGDVGVMTPLLTIELDPVGEGTQIRQTVEYVVLPEMRPAGWLLERLFVNRTMANGVKATLNNAKRMAEAEHAKRMMEAETETEVETPTREPEPGPESEPEPEG